MTIPVNEDREMTTVQTDSEVTLADAEFAGDLRTDETFRDAVRGYLQRVRGGDMGSLPAVLGLLVLFVVFGLANDRFLSALNLANLITQAGAICVLAMGLVFVLLLGDIDLSAGVAGGVSACVMALLIVNTGWPWWAGLLAGIACGAAIGLTIGLLRAKLGIPSFVVTLAFFLGLQGVTLKLIGEGGSVRVDDKVIRGLTISNLPVTAGWAIAWIVVIGFAALTFFQHRRQRALKLAHAPTGVVVARVAAVAAVVLGVTYLLSVNRSVNPNNEIRGVPYVLPLVLVLLIVLTVVLRRTSYGRHIYAVGGNAEAARRAGIPVDRIRVSVFVMCSSLAALSGIIAASYAGKVSASSGAGNTLLYAVGAAVIGGTSLFGGKGRAIDAVIGGVVVATIANGLGLLNQSSYINFLVTGGVLLLAASVDAVSRRRRSSAGLA
ncbi:inner-membrane translocator [Mycolicibacterium phlei]|uniref:Xylose transport system permease protein XylH n=2 Tax=Mycolicibacterium phlei TaxID=1771 RepID=A0A5N5V3S6_MYCPH|nr:Xylose transport system permease protein XylH [Mycolicibacterium phlei]KAB7755160.1 ABC transporter permease [Mycolicibacterium phlei DSM 43239 = CCUG 21000]KXW59860.1 ABC transporter permease [Mycolicibacterium phlei DSM 43072]KXW67135.1 ABC transporter permease [Mycolicibacterium phlei DSM 43070]VEG07477.1 inner-membrane translocator [Mycobacteroides chelonae]